MKARAIFAAAVALAALGLYAETKSVIDYKPITCIRGGELPVLQMNVEGPGELRAYFRRINTTDWCSVEGVNDGPLSRIVLPKFDTGDEVEYFIVLLRGRRVVARSPRIYRARVTADCELPFARHIQRISMSCGDDGTGIPSSLGAGYALSRREPPECVPCPGRPGDCPPSGQ